MASENSVAAASPLGTRPRQSDGRPSSITSRTAEFALDPRRLILQPQRPVSMRMCSWIARIEAPLDPNRTKDECWLHPKPPPARKSKSGGQRARGAFQKGFSVRPGIRLSLNYGLVLKIARGTLTREQEDGFVHEQWHLSHLCGNWPCVNPDHMTVEPGDQNISRNSCFGCSDGCRHQPPCMKEKKRMLDVHGKLVYPEECLA